MKESDRIMLRQYCDELHPKVKGGHYLKGDPTAIKRIEELCDNAAFLARQDALLHVSKVDETNGRKLMRRARRLYVFSLSVLVVGGIALYLGLYLAAGR